MLKAPVDLHWRPIVTEEDARELKTFFSPVNETLWGKLHELEDKLGELRSMYEHHDYGQDTHTALRILDQAHRDLERARTCIDRRRKWWHRWFENYTLFWQLVHRVEADLLLVLSLEELGAHAAEICGDFERNITDTIERAVWLGGDQKGQLGAEGRLTTALKTIDDELKKPASPHIAPSARLVAQRESVRHALEMVNSFSERSLQDLNFSLLIRVCSALGLFCFGVLAVIVWFENDVGELRVAFTQSWPLQIVLILAGGMGAYLALILAEEPKMTTRGPARRHLLYYLFARPTLGSFAAFFFMLLLQTQILFVVGEPPNDPSANAADANKSNNNGDSTDGAPNAAPALFNMRVPPEQLTEVYVLIALVAGYGGERLLSKTMNEVLGRLQRRADKKQPSGPAEAAT